MTLYKLYTNKKKLFFGTAIACFAVGLFFSSCAKDYETVPLGQQSTIDLIFDVHDSAGLNAIQYLSNVYNDALISGHNRVGGDYLDAASDDAVSSFSGLSNVEQIAEGAYTSTQVNADDIWTKSYNTIRAATIFVNNINIVPLKELLPNGELARAAYRSEARFLRAWTYFELLRRYGGVPITKDSVYQLTDDVNLPRQSFENTVNYIVNELDDIKDSLRPEEDVNPTSYGRITKGAAMALKAKVLLYAASPLFNGGNIDPSNTLTGYTSFDANRWKLAADAAKDVMDLGTYGLVQNYADVFTTQAEPVGTNNEVIFWRQNGSNTSVEKTNGPIGYTSAGGSGRTSPTQNLVDAFPTIDGLAITDNSSGYNQDHPYENRDPRLKASIFYNGTLWLNRAVQTFDGGLDKPGGTVQQTKTGYYMRKFMGDFETVNGSPVYSNTIHDWIYLRYAEVLLDYAEAQNEYAGPSADVYDVLFKLRKRAGISEGTDMNYGLDLNMNQVDMQAAIRNERRIEMAFEEQRYWDIRRWKIAEDIYSKPLYGLDIQQTGQGELFYNKSIALQPSFTAPKMYLYPIPYSEVVKNKKMVQNPGW